MYATDSELEEPLLTADALIEPLFEPIVDLRHGIVAGYEVFAGNVIEIRDHATFQATVRHYVAHGRRITLGGLLPSITFVTGVVKLSSAHTHDTKSVLIADRIENWEQVRNLVRRGIEWAQGPLFGGPSARPEQLTPSMSRRLWSAAAKPSL